MAGVPTGVTGARVSSDLTAAEVVRDVSPAVLMLQDDKKSFMTYLSSLRTEAAADVKFEWFEDEITPKTGTVGASADNSTAVIDLSGLSNNVYLTVDDQIKIPSTGEIVRVSASAEFASAVSVVRSINAVTATIPAGSQWTKIGDARDELSRLYNGDTLHSVSVQPASAYNYTQTFRTGLGVSRREKKRKLYTAQGSNDFNRQKVKALLEHCEKQEHAFLHGARTDSGNGATNNLTGRTTTGGAISFIPSGNTEAITTLTEAEFEDFVRRITRYGATGKRTLFCSRYVASLISAWGRDRQRITSPGRTVTHGVEIDKYLAGCGTTVEIVPTHALEGRPGHTTRGVWDGYGLLLDMEGKAKKVFGGDNMVWADGLEPDDADGETGAYLSDVGYLPGDARKDGLITGVTA